MKAMTEKKLINACELLIEQYNQMPDGPLGKGLTNRPFLEIKEILKKYNKEKNQ